MANLLSLILIFIVGSKNYRAEETNEKCEDLLYTSMQGIVSLNQLVTQLSVQVAILTTSLSVLQVNGEKTQRDLENAESKIAALEDYGMRAMEKKIEKVTSSLSMVKDNVGLTQKDVAVTKTKLADLEKKGMQVTTSLSTMNETLSTMNEKVGETLKDVAVTKTKIADLEDEGMKGLQNQIHELTTSVAKTNAKMDDIEDEVIVVSGEDNAGPRKCVKVCAGTTGRESTNWIKFNADGVYTDVDLKSCRFTMTPSVTTSIEGSTNHWTTRGTASIYNTSPTGFRMYLYHNGIYPSRAIEQKWNVEWIAVGYTC